METFYIKSGDRLPALRAQLLDGNFLPVPLAGATVTFNMTNSAGTLVLSDAACTILDTLNAVVQYAWQAGDTSTAGTYQGEFAVVAAGLEESFPNDHNFFIIITAALG